MAGRRKNKTQLKTIERLKLFKRRADELGNLRLVRSEAKMHFRISWDAESKLLRHQITEPDEEDLRSFLMLFRRFISESEQVYINRVFNDCLRFLSDDVLKEEIQKAKEAWQTGMHLGLVRMYVDETNLAPEYVLDLWINGYYFHDDVEKLAELERLLRQPLCLVRMQFLSILPNLTFIILYLGQVVAHGLKEGLFQIPPNLS